MEKAQRYRERAEDLRNITDGLPESNGKRMLLSLAREYDRLAGLIEGEDAASTPPESAPIAALKKPDDSNLD